MGFWQVTSLIYFPGFSPFSFNLFPLSDVHHRTYVTMTHISCYINNYHKLNNNNYTEDHNNNEHNNDNDNEYDNKDEDED